MEASSRKAASRAVAQKKVSEVGKMWHPSDLTVKKREYQTVCAWEGRRTKRHKQNFRFNYLEMRVQAWSAEEWDIFAAFLFDYTERVREEATKRELLNGQPPLSSPHEIIPCLSVSFGICITFWRHLTYFSRFPNAQPNVV